MNTPKTIPITSNMIDYVGVGPGQAAGIADGAHDR